MPALELQDPIKEQHLPQDTVPSTSTSEVTTATFANCFVDAWRDFTNWIGNFLSGINGETLEHPYYISFALLVIWAWPHLLMLPIWFGKDAYKRMEDQVHNVASSVRAAAPGSSQQQSTRSGHRRERQNKRNAFTTYYHSIMNASYGEPRPAQRRRPLFGGTPLSEGDFSIEEERSLHPFLRAVRWTALIWAVFILGREVYFKIVY